MKPERFDHYHHARRLWMRSGPPPWWPRDETWPPTRPGWRRARRRLFPRVLLTTLGALLVSTLFCSGAIFLLQSLAAGLDLAPETAAFGVGAAALIFLAAATIAGRNMRHFFAPLDSLLEASDRLAAGERGVHVREQGGPEIRALIRSFNSMSRELQHQSEERKNLLADVTHELRTPLTVIQGGIEGMLDGLYDREDPRLVELLAETRRMSELIEDLRMLALAERGALNIRKEPTDLFQLASETLAAFRSQAETGSVELRLQAGNELPLIEVDPVRIGQVLSNLVMNALRYTPAGGVVEVALASPRPSEVQIEIRDTGDGIAPEDLPHVFDRFYKGRDSQGSGLGLAIARQLVEVHGGRIQAESQPGQGTTMTIKLPL